MTLNDDIQTADAVADEAEALRQDLRWNVAPTDPDRQSTIDATLESIRVAMVPVRAAAGRAVWGQLSAAEERDVKNVSQRLQYERKQLKKMRR